MKSGDSHFTRLCDPLTVLNWIHTVNLLFFSPPQELQMGSLWYATQYINLPTLRMWSVPGTIKLG